MTPYQIAYIRRYCCTFIASVSTKLWARGNHKEAQRDPHLVEIMSTALTLFHRYYSRKAFIDRKVGPDMHLSRYDVSMACCFLAGKAHEDVRKAEHVVLCARDTLSRHSKGVFDLNATSRVRGKAEKQITEDFIRALLRAERKLLHVCEFDVDIEHPHRYLEVKLKGLGLYGFEDVKERVDNILRVAYLYTSLCVQMQPAEIADASVLLAAHLHGKPLPMETQADYGKFPWYVVTKTTKTKLAIALGQLLEREGKCTAREVLDALPPAPQSSPFHGLPRRKGGKSPSADKGPKPASESGTPASGGAADATSASSSSASSSASSAEAHAGKEAGDGAGADARFEAGSGSSSLLSSGAGPHLLGSSGAGGSGTAEPALYHADAAPAPAPGTAGGASAVAATGDTAGSIGSSTQAVGSVATAEQHGLPGNGSGGHGHTSAYQVAATAPASSAGIGAKRPRSEGDSDEVDRKAPPRPG